MTEKCRKIIAAGHICLDITPVFPQGKSAENISELLAPGKLVNVDSADIHTGGSVANTGLALKILGNDVMLLGKIGDDDFGKTLTQVLSRYGADGLVVDKRSSTSYSVVIAVPGFDRIFLHNPGANDTFESGDIPEIALKDAVLFHFGYPPLMRKMYENDGAELEKIFASMKEREIATSLDFAAIDPNSDAGKVDWQTVLKRTLPYVDFFVPSFEELCFMLDREKYGHLSALGGDVAEKLDIERDVIPLAEKALALGCKTVLIKCGTAGMYFRAGNVSEIGKRLALDEALWAGKEIYQPCFKADRVLSATGAGDTSIAAFLSAVMRGRTPEAAVRLAAAEGACAVTTYDALSGLKSIEELDARIASGWEKEN